MEAEGAHMAYVPCNEGESPAQRQTEVPLHKETPSSGLGEGGTTGNCLCHPGQRRKEEGHPPQLRGKHTRRTALHSGVQLTNADLRQRPPVFTELSPPGQKWRPLLLKQLRDLLREDKAVKQSVTPLFASGNSWKLTRVKRVLLLGAQSLLSRTATARLGAALAFKVTAPRLPPSASFAGHVVPTLKGP